MREPGHRFQVQGILIHMPVKRIRPRIQSEYRRLIIDIIDKKILMSAGILRKPCVQPVDKSGSSRFHDAVLVSKQPVKGVLHIVLYDRAFPTLLGLFPRFFEMFKLSVKLFPCIPRTAAHFRPEGNVSVACMKVNNIRGKCRQCLIPKYSIFPILSELRFIKNRLNPMVQEKKFKNSDNIMRCTPTQNRNVLLYPAASFGLQKLFHLFWFFQDQFTVKWVLQFF